MSTNLTDLPLELLEHVVDYLWNDRPSLKAISLTCSSFMEPSRSHLFAKLVLSQHKAKQLYNITDPQLFTFVPAIRDLTLSYETPAKRRTTETQLLAFVKLVQPDQLNTLRLCGYPRSGSDLLKHATLSTFRYITMLSLEAVEFTTFSAFTCLLASFPLLRVVALDNLAWDGLDSDPMHSRAVFAPQLEQLSLRQCYVRDVLSWLIEYTHPIKLRSLDLGMIRESDTQAIGHFLSFISCSLECLRFGFDGLCSGGDAEAFNYHVNLRNFTRLQPLHIDNFVTTSYTLEDAYPHIINLLTTAPPESPLATLSLSIDLRDSASVPVYDEMMDWEAFNNVLSAEPFEGLVKLTLLVLYARDTQAVQDFWRKLPDMLPGVNLGRILEFKALLTS